MYSFKLPVGLAEQELKTAINNRVDDIRNSHPGKDVSVKVFTVWTHCGTERKFNVDVKVL